MQAYLEFGRISVIIPMSFVCSSIATPNADDDLPSAFLTPSKPYLYSLVRLRSTVRGRPAWPDSGWRWILSADNLDCTRSGPLSQRRTLNRSVCRSEALARNCTGCRWYEAPLEKKMSTIKWREMQVVMKGSSRTLVVVGIRRRQTKTNRVRVTLVDKVKASSRLAALSVELQHDLIGCCQGQRLS